MIDVEFIKLTSIFLVFFCFFIYCAKKISGLERAFVDRANSYRTLYDMSPDGILVVDREGHIVKSNAAACDLFGYSANELDGLLVDALVPSSARAGHPQLREGYHKADKKGLVKHRTVQALRKDGSGVDVEIRLSNIPSNKTSDTLVTVHDVSERVIKDEMLKERADDLESRKLLKDILFDNLTEAVLACDSSGNIIEVNKVAKPISLIVMIIASLFITPFFNSSSISCSSSVLISE